MADPRKWKKFERLVAAIHKLADEGAKVKWNEKITRRQFDVTIRFKKGLYEYLTVIECKDYSRAVPVGEVDAFVTKSVDAKADRGVMASSSGFQTGAQEVAGRHNITLLHVSDFEEIDLIFGAQFGENLDALHIKTVAIGYADGEHIELPEASHELKYYLNHILIEIDGSQTCLGDLVHNDVQNHAQTFLGRAHNDYESHIIVLPAGAVITAPDDEDIPLKGVVRIHAQVAMTSARTLHGPVEFDPALLNPNVDVKDIATGESQTFKSSDLALGVDTEFEEGKFYENPNLQMFYYCDEINGDKVNIYLVESFQLGQLFQAEFILDTKYANRYIEVSDKVVLHRLRKRLKKLKA